MFTKLMHSLASDKQQQTKLGTTEATLVTDGPHTSSHSAHTQDFNTTLVKSVTPLQEIRVGRL
jgi:hypothetical protein